MIKKEFVSRRIRLSDNEIMFNMLDRLKGIKILVPVKKMMQTQYSVTVADFFQLSVQPSYKDLVKSIQDQPTEASLINSISTLTGRDSKEISKGVDELYKRTLRDLILKLATFKVGSVDALPPVTIQDFRGAITTTRSILSKAAISSSYSSFITEANELVEKNSILGLLFAYSAFAMKKDVPSTQVTADLLYSELLDLGSNPRLSFFSYQRGKVFETAIQAPDPYEFKLMPFLIRLDRFLMENKFGGSVETFQTSAEIDISSLIQQNKISPLLRGDNFPLVFSSKDPDIDIWSDVSQFEQIFMAVSVLEALSQTEGSVADIRPGQLTEREQMGTQPYQLRLLGTTIQVMIKAHNLYLSKCLALAHKLRTVCDHKASGVTLPAGMTLSYYEVFGSLPEASPKKILDELVNRLDRQAAEKPLIHELWFTTISADPNITTELPGKPQPRAYFSKMKASSFSFDQNAKFFRIFKVETPRNLTLLEANYPYTVYPGTSMYQVKPTFSIPSSASTSIVLRQPSSDRNFYRLMMSDPLFREVLPIGRIVDMTLPIESITDATELLRRDLIEQSSDSDSTVRFERMTSPDDVLFALDMMPSPKGQALVKSLGMTFPAHVAISDEYPEIISYTDHIGANGVVDVFNDVAMLTIDNARPSVTKQVAAIRRRLCVSDNWIPVSGRDLPAAIYPNFSSSPGAPKKELESSESEEEEESDSEQTK